MIKSSTVTLLLQRVMDFAGRPHSHIVALVVIIGLTLGATLINLGAYPYSWLDEGFSINAAVTLVETGQYGTTSSEGIRPFDPAISSGSPLIVPLALNISIFGNRLAQARMVIVGFALVSVICLYLLAEKLYGKRMALWIIILILSLPPLAEISLLLKARLVLGEVPSFMFLIIAILLWMRDWESKTVVFALASGLLAGLGFLTKLQVILPFLPTVIFIAILRAKQGKGHFIRQALPAFVAVAVYIIWVLFTQSLSPAEVRQENSIVIIDGIRTNFFTDLRGASLSPGMYLILALLLFGLGGWYWRAYRVVGRVAAPERNKHWIEATLAVYVGFSVVWVYVFSIGWPRYIFGGLIIGLLLVGRSLYALLVMVVHRWSSAKNVETGVYAISLGMMLVMGFFTHVLPTISYDEPRYDEMMITYIDQHVDRAAVIETWEWDITGRGLHRNYHMPHQLLLQYTLRQRSLNEQIDFNYDVLQASPDYLLIGPFGGWMHIYDTPQRRVYFETEVHIGKYRLLRRVYPKTRTYMPEATLER